MSTSEQANVFYLVGPSGSGKDSIINGLRSKLCDEEQLLIAHRYITRELDNLAENHIALRDDEFNRRRSAGLFVMHWQANNYSYGIGCEVNHWLNKGFSVLFNGSRQQIPLAKLIFSERLKVIAIDVSPERLVDRLQKRGREQGDQITARLQRSLQYQQSLPTNCWRLDNNGDLQTCVDKLYAYISTKNNGLSV